MKNEKIKIALMKSGLRQYELACIMGISETTLGRRLREELPEEEQDRIVKLIEEGGHNDD